MKLKVCVGLALALAGAQASAQYRGPDTGENVKVAWADVLRADPVYEQVRSERPHEVCEDVPVQYRESGGNRTAGTVIGAIVGGALGNTVGKGDGRRAATIAGAVAGGAVGNNVASGSDTWYSGVEQRCRVVTSVRQEDQLVGYDVQYRYRGDVYLARMDYDPGERMRVRVSVAPAE